MFKSIPQAKTWIPSSCNTETILLNCGQEKTLSSILNTIYHLYASEKGKSRWGDKTPKNLHSIDAILSLYPNAKIVIVVRDCRDVALSLNKAEFSRASFITSSIRWQKDVNHTIKAIKKYSSNIFILKYEDLLTTPKKTLRQLLSFCELSEDPLLLERYSRHDDDVTHTKSSLYMKPISKDNLGKWKKNLSSSDIQDIEALAKAGLTYFNYPLVNSNAEISRSKIISSKVIDFIRLSKNRKNLENYLSFIYILIKFLSRR